MIEERKRSARCSIHRPVLPTCPGIGICANLSILAAYHMIPYDTMLRGGLWPVVGWDGMWEMLDVLDILVDNIGISIDFPSTRLC